MVEVKRDSDKGWINWFGLLFGTPDESTAKDNLKASQTDKENLEWFLGYDKDSSFTIKGGFEGMQPSFYVLRWERFLVDDVLSWADGDNSRVLHNYFTFKKRHSNQWDSEKDLVATRELITKEDNEVLFNKYNKFRDFMQSIAIGKGPNLEELASSYNLGFDVKPNIVPMIAKTGEMEKPYIELNVFYKGKKLDDFFFLDISEEELEEYSKKYPDKKFIVEPEFGCRDIIGPVLQSLDNFGDLDHKINIRVNKIRNAIKKFSKELLKDCNNTIKKSVYNNYHNNSLNKDFFENKTDEMDFLNNTPEKSKEILENLYTYKRACQTVLNIEKKFLKKEFDTELIEMLDLESNSKIENLDYKLKLSNFDMTIYSLAYNILEYDVIHTGFLNMESVIQRKKEEYINILRERKNIINKKKVKKTFSSGWVGYYPLRYSKENDAENIFSDNDFEFVGSDISEDVEEGEFFWYRSKKPFNSGSMNFFYDEKEKICESPDNLKRNSKLNNKYGNLFFFMKSINKRTFFLLKKISEEYKIGIDVKADVSHNLKNTSIIDGDFIKFDLFYKDNLLDELFIKSLDKEKLKIYEKDYPNKKFCAELVPNNIFNPEFKKLILTSIDENLSLADRIELRLNKYNSVTRQYANELKKQFVVDEESVKYIDDNLDNELNKDYVEGFREGIAFRRTTSESAKEILRSTLRFQKNIYQNILCEEINCLNNGFSQKINLFEFDVKIENFKKNYQEVKKPKRIIMKKDTRSFSHN